VGTEASRRSPPRSSTTARSTRLRKTRKAATTSQRRTVITPTKKTHTATNIAIATITSQSLLRASSGDTFSLYTPRTYTPKEANAIRSAYSVPNATAHPKAID
jgi:hypothetical protein